MGFFYSVVRHHKMPHLQAEAVEAMTRAFRQMERALTPPQRVSHSKSFVFRYERKGIHEALLQKLARTISGLNAIAVLLNSGYVQEVGVLFRTLDEIHEDIFFLATAETNAAKTERHDQYLQAFYSEAIFSRPKDSLDISKPNMVPRKKIRAHTMNTLGQGDEYISSACRWREHRYRLLRVRTRRFREHHGHVRRRPATLSPHRNARNAANLRVRQGC